MLWNASVWGVEVQQARPLATGEVGVGATDGLKDAAGDRVVATDGNRLGAGGVDVLVEVGDHFDRALVVVALRQRHVAQVVDAAHVPRVDTELTVDSSPYGGYVAHSPGAEVLVALGSAVAGGVGNADQRDVGIGRVGVGVVVVVVVAAKQRGDAIPVDAVHQPLLVGALRHRGLPRRLLSNFLGWVLAFRVGIENTGGMQGSFVPDCELLDAAALCAHLVPEGSVHAFLAEHWRRLFPDDMFTDLFTSKRGCPSVPADVIATVMVLQALEGLSDREAVRQLETNIGWKAATGLALTDEAFYSTVLVLWRGKLRRSERPQRIFDAVRLVITESDVLAGKHRRALDSTVLDDAVARLDTITMLTPRRSAGSANSSPNWVRCGCVNTTLNRDVRHAISMTRPIGTGSCRSLLMTRTSWCGRPKTSSTTAWC